MRWYAALTTLILAACVPVHDAGFMLARPHWDATPLGVCAEGYAGDEAGAFKIVGDAVATINERLGFKLYALSRARCDVRAVIGAPYEPGFRDPGGDAVYVAGRAGCAITTSNTGTDELTFYVVQHELGHCAGLDHDDWTGSIMRRVQTETEPGSWPPHITDGDRALLRAAYMR